MRRVWLGAVVACVGFMVVPAGPVHAAATCGGKAATITGTSGNDRITGTNGDDVIAAGAGDDTVFALDGNDIVCGGPGVDYLLGEAGADRLYGELGNDALAGGPGDDTVIGGDGDDKMYSDGTYDGADAFHGSAGFDRVGYSSRAVGLTVRMTDAGSHPADEDFINVDVEEIWGTQGDDTIIIAVGADNTVHGGIGDDTIDVADGVPGNDKIVGGYGIDQCRADDGDVVQSCP